MKRTVASVPVAATVAGIWIELLWLDQHTTEIITGRAISTLRKFCRRHGIRIYTIPGERKDADGSTSIDHLRCRSSPFRIHIWQQTGC
jgi:hypothetical protein